MNSFTRLLALACTAILGLVSFANAQTPAAPVGPNSDPTYRQLRDVTLGTEAVTVSNFDLRRDAVTFDLHSGTVCFVTPVNGKVTGAVFTGDGSMTLDPPNDTERRSLKLLTKSDEFNESFERLVLRFTDSTYDEIKKAGTAAAQGGCDSGPLKDSQNAMRYRIRYNLDARILEDVLRTGEGGLFVAFIHGKHYDDKLLYVVDPNGAPDVSPQEVELSTYDENIGSGAEPGSAAGQGSALGTLSTVSMMKVPLSQAEYAVKLYTDYFGPLPYKRLSLTQQTACTYGQSWPGLVWLPICAFYDVTVRHQLGLDWADNGYWDVVTPHEVAHQWWGQLVGFDSYRDQWMSEGFADFSASLFLENAYGKDSAKMYAKFWNDERRSIVEKNQFGFRAVDVGPVTMGYRLNSSKAGFNIYRDLIYPKGAYILQMIRMMMWNPKTGDQNFKAMMHDFTSTYGGRTATTEDFKAIVEKHMTGDMNPAGDGKMDWFFNEYVYGTALPSYQFDGTFANDPTGSIVFSYKLTQSGVNSNFLMVLPVYLELADGHVIQLGHMRITGDNTIAGKVRLNGVKDAPKRAMIEYRDDILAAN
ncbi:MAG TPA: M1 family aminopeptidase [Candidatus Acidoferrum sp.]|nr:M1 family aminopeptidase [Candidatus Acidoferrum sp.]